jgi:hypothetical protein
MVRLVTAGAGDWESRGASPSIVEAEAEDCIIVICVIPIRTTSVLSRFFVLSIGLVGNRMEDWKKVRDLSSE